MHVYLEHHTNATERYQSVWRRTLVEWTMSVQFLVSFVHTCSSFHSHAYDSTWKYLCWNWIQLVDWRLSCPSHPLKSAPPKAIHGCVKSDTIQWICSGVAEGFTCQWLKIWLYLHTMAHFCYKMSSEISQLIMADNWKASSWTRKNMLDHEAWATDTMSGSWRGVPAIS